MGHTGYFEVELEDGSRGVYDGRNWNSETFSADLLEALNLSSGDVSNHHDFVDDNGRACLRWLGIENYEVIKVEHDPYEDIPPDAIM